MHGDERELLAEVIFLPNHGTGPRRQDQFVWFSGRGGYRGMRRFVLVNPHKIFNRQMNIVTLGSLCLFICAKITQTTV